MRGRVRRTPPCFPFFLDGDRLKIVRWLGDRNQFASYRTVDWSEGIPENIAECPQVELPFHHMAEGYPVPEGQGRVEFSPSDDKVVLFASGDYRHLRIGVIQADGPPFALTLDQPRTRSKGPKLAWWTKDGAFAIHEKGQLHHVAIAEDALVATKVEPGRLLWESVPEGASKGRGLAFRRWALKGPQTLIRRHRRTGAPLAGYRLPRPCVGSTIWLSDNLDRVFLVAEDFELIRVDVPPQ